jgi:hypothetical protein
LILPDAKSFAPRSVEPRSFSVDDLESSHLAAAQNLNFITDDPNQTFGGTENQSFGCGNGIPAVGDLSDAAE